MVADLAIPGLTDAANVTVVLPVPDAALVTVSHPALDTDVQSHGLELNAAVNDPVALAALMLVVLGVRVGIKQGSLDSIL